MNNSWITALWLSVLCPILAASALHAESQGSAPTIELSQCLLPGTSIKAQCGTLSVLENPSDPTGQQIDISIAVVPAQNRRGASDPLFMFAGGPGQGAIESFAPLLNSFARLRQNRDIVLIDQRGTGNSNPLNCQQDDNQLSLQPEPSEIANYVKECLQQLPGDPRYYTTEIAVKDFDQVREALGYKTINILGVSYGTRVAQTYMRRYPNRVRTAILDGVVPTELALGSEHALKLQQALLAVFQRCAEQPACNNAFPDLRQKLAQLVTITEQSPPTLSVPHPRSGALTELTVTRDILATAIRLLSYSTETQALIPLLISTAVDSGDLSAIASQGLMIEQQLQGAISRGMEWSVICSEDQLQPTQLLLPNNSDNTLMGNIMQKVSAQICRIWPPGQVAPDFHTPFNSDIPTLLLSGELDPVTPPEYAEQALQQFSQGLHLVAKGQGHSISSRGCLPDIIAQFLHSGSIDNLNIERLKQFAPAPFFTTLMGPEP